MVFLITIVLHLYELIVVGFIEYDVCVDEFIGRSAEVSFGRDIIRGAHKCPALLKASLDVEI